MSAAPESPNSAAPSSAAAVTVKVDAPSVLPADGVAAGAAPTAGGATPTHASTDASSSDPTPSSPKAADAKGKKGRGGRGKPKEVLPRVPFRQLFRYATGADMLLNTIAAVAATGNGFIFPGFALLFGDLLSQFNTVTSTDEFVAKINRYALWFLLIAIGAGVTALLENALPMITAERQIRRVREAYVNALLRQEVAFYDTNKAGELASRMIEDTLTMSGGIAEKSFASIHYSITFLGGIAVGFARSWQLTLVMFGALPVIMVVMAFLTNSVRKFSSNEANAYAKAGDAATEAFSAIRTVAAFGAEEHEVERYDSHLAVAEKNGASKGVWVGGAVGAIFGCIFIFYGLSSLVAGVLIIRDRDANPACYNPNTPGCFTGGDVVATLMAVLIGSFSLGQVGPNFSAFASAQVAAYKLYAIIDRVPPIDVQSPAGAKPSPASLAGAIEFRNVTFAYPSRKTEPVLRNFSLAIRGGTTVALVGESGCGKSTLMQLFQRFYDVDEGEVLVDGINVKEWNLAHLRERVGVVSQEPTLFGTSVGENIGYGKPASAGPATQAEIEAAATAANAHEFISRLPEGYGTVVGTSVASTQLSGGQRQRVCIARAILRDPKYLLLDEATSALDTKSERQVEAALAKLLSRDAVTGVRGTRTTLLIAHRLSTVTNADRIVVMHRGEVIEDGNHVSLMGLEGGAYRRLRELQDMAAEAAAASLAAGTDFAGPSSPRTPAAAAGTGVVVPAPEHVGVAVATSTGVATPSAGSATSATVMTPGARAPAALSGAVTVPVDSDPTPAAPAAPTAADGLTIQRAPSIRTDAAALSKGTVAAAAAPATAADAAKGGKSAAAKPAAGAPAAPKEDKEWEREKAKLPPVKMSRVWALQAPEWAYLAIGLLGATLSGITQPVFAIIWSNMIAFFFGPNEQLKDNTRMYVLWFFLLGIAQVVVTIMRIGGFVYAGEKLTRRLRAMAYRAILRQEIGFFEEKGNSVGRLSTRLQADAAEVKGATGEGLSLVFQAGAAVIAGIVIAFQANWRLALVVVAIMPFMVLASLVQGAAFKGYNHGAAKALEESGHIAVESTAAIKTVTAFNLQPQLLQAFSRSLEVPMRAGFGKAYSVGLGQLFQGFMMFSAYALAFYAGGQFIAKDWCTFPELMRVYLAVTMSAQAAGNAINWGPSMDKAERATRSVFALLDRQSAVDPMAKEGVALPAGQRVAGLVELKNVTFAYPTRPDTPAIQNLSLTIRPGQKVALVGPSGSGKSTVIQLLERFYLPSQGQILLDNRPIEGYNVSWLRTQFGLIQQEPSLFADSVRYNIEYGQVGGKPAWDKGAPLEPPKDYMPAADQLDAPPAIVAAAEGANAASFVNASKYRYATHCGTRGNQQLSGGQRQRLCIARVMLRNPPIAFADEATSALDTSSERIVQAAIDRMLRADVVAGGAGAAGADGTSGARTSIVVAHRLSTIRDADVIFVLDKGRLVEQGTHEELMALPEGLYRSLAVAQGVGETLGSPSAAAEPPVSPSAGAAVTPVAGGAAL